MVLTENNGNFMTSGFTGVASAGWMDPFTWQSGSYRISNFKGSRGKCNYLNLFGAMFRKRRSILLLEPTFRKVCFAFGSFFLYFSVH